MINLLHCADLHLDSPFSALPPEQAAHRRAMQRQLPGRIAALCRELSCDLLLCSGDLFDGERVRPETIDALRQAFSACPVPVFVAPGNHDPYGPQSPWASVAWPEQVHIFRGPWESVTLPDLGCRVWGAGFTEHTCEEPLPPITPGPLVELGVLHGDPTTPGPYRYLPARDLEACGLDYLALGHIHKPCLPRQYGKTWVGWPGIPMGRGFDETGVHGIFQVRVDKTHCEAKLLPLTAPRYEIVTARAGRPLELPPDTGDWICRLILTGESEPFDAEALRQKLLPRFYALEIRDQTVPPMELWEACGRQTLRGQALKTLKDAYDQAEPSDRQTLALAARYVLAALEGREEP